MNLLTFIVNLFEVIVQQSVSSSSVLGSPTHPPVPVAFTFTEVMAIISVVVSVCVVVIGFLLRRSIFDQIDKKVDKAICEQIESAACRDREEMKTDLKEGRKKIEFLHRKIDMILMRLKIPSPTIIEDNQNGNGGI